MLSVKARILIIGGLLVLLAIIINEVRRRRLELKYVLAWLIADLALILFAAVPQSMMWLASLLGIYSPVNMIFFLGFIFLALIIFALTVALSRATANHRRLAQSVALRDFEERLKNTDASSESQTLGEAGTSSGTQTLGEAGASSKAQTLGETGVSSKAHALNETGTSREKQTLTEERH